MQCFKQDMVLLALLGMPDYGLLNAGETTDNARRIVQAVNVPVLLMLILGMATH